MGRTGPRVAIARSCTDRGGPVISRLRAAAALRGRVAETTPGEPAALPAPALRDGAATITYYAMLSLFPALLLVASVAGIAGGRGLIEDAQQAALDAGLGPEAQQVVGDAVDNALRSSSGALGITSVVSLALALYGASGVLDAAGRQLEAVFGVAGVRTTGPAAPARRAAPARERADRRRARGARGDFAGGDVARTCSAKAPGPSGRSCAGRSRCSGRRSPSRRSSAGHRPRTTRAGPRC